MRKTTECIIKLLSILILLPVDVTHGQCYDNAQCYVNADIALYQEDTPYWLFQDMYNQCLANFTLYNENDIDDYPQKGITCSKKNSVATDSVWMYNDTILNCGETGNFNGHVYCDRRQPGSITLYTRFNGDSGWPQGVYTCCIEGSCISARIYQHDEARNRFITGKSAVVDSCTFDPPSDISQVPQVYTVHMITSGIPTVLVSSAINCTNAYSGSTIVCGRSYYTLVDLEHERFRYSVPVTWNGDPNYTEHYYNCTANYGVDKKGRVVIAYEKLVKIRAPKPPTSVTYTILSSSSVTINWTVDDSMNGFVVNVSSMNEDPVHSTEVIRDPLARSLNVSGLVLNREYRIDVRGFIDLIGAATTITVRLEVPQISSIDTQTNTSSFSLQWSVEDKRNLIHNFTIIYTSLCNYTDHVVTVNNTNLTIDGLSPGLSYNVSLRPWSIVGVGNITSVLVQLQANGPPGVAPIVRSLQVINASSVRLSWDSVDCGSRNGHLTDYRIAYSPSTQTGSHVTVADVSSTRYDITELTEDTMYHFQIAAVNDDGVGPYSSPMAIFTVNSTITGLQSQEESISIVELSWRPAVSSIPSDIVVQYEVAYVAIDGNNTSTSDSTGVLNMTSVVNTSVALVSDGLIPNTWYMFGVRMITSVSVSAGQFTSIIVKTRSESIDLFSTMLSNSSTVLLSWSPLPDSSIDEYMYDIGYSVCPDDQTMECTWSITSSNVDTFNKTYTMYESTDRGPVTIYGLTSSTCYLFGVRVRSLRENRRVGKWNIVRNFTTMSTQAHSCTVSEDLSAIPVSLITTSAVAGVLLILVVCLTCTTACLIHSNKKLKKELSVYHLSYNSYCSLNSLQEKTVFPKRSTIKQYNPLRSASQHRRLHQNLLDTKVAPTAGSEYANDDISSPLAQEEYVNEAVYDRITDTRPKTPTYLEIKN